MLFKADLLVRLTYVDTMTLDLDSLWLEKANRTNCMIYWLFIKTEQ